MSGSFRPPIVTVMGHIDHGKTSLLDKIRSANIAAKEAGGITQHLSSYQTTIKTKSGKTGTITFIDTPGHAAFCQMRSRGAQLTDIIVLVVSGIDGVMAQTKECIKEIKKTNCPVIVAMTKIDLEGVSPEKVKGQLVELEMTPEEYGGQVPLIPVSSKTGQGIDDLLESILLHAEIMELSDETTNPLEAIVVESRLDKSRGPVASLIVKKGVVSLGDSIFADSVACKVKAIIDSNGHNIKSAGPSVPCEILGFESVPSVGSIISNQKTERAIIKKEVLSNSPSDTPKLNVVIKADVQGTLEALLNTFSDDVVVVHQGIGAVSDTDVFLAQSAKATIYAFNVPLPKFIKNLADNEKVPIFESRIIYEIIEDIQSRVLKLLDPTIEETVNGEGKIIAEFSIDKVRIAGIQVTKGEITKGDQIHLQRDSKIIKDTKVEGIRRGKEIVDKIKAGSDCGMTFKPYVDFKINDVIISYNTKK
ncbi:MAG TPA: GTP-binding protein [Candidatus Woesebacteria bacterium]|nr:GTP-binding protein [Candidatus Woesebacteria bacterium]